ncbi:MAG: cyclophilin [Treponema sp. GWC1_61_84]|nr:MAG: cyclophilin [Treponema sp. GWC1_61_84]
MPHTVNTRVLFETTLGNILIELDDQKSHETAKNFADYVRAGFYDGTVFHRIIPGFMVQGGGMLPGMNEKKGHAPIRNEATNGLKNLRGTLSMARTNDPHSATSQFFINLVDNVSLDHKAPFASSWGYAVFGKVVEGMDVVDAMAKVATGSRGPHDDVPTEDIVVTKATIVPAQG